jgi:hypothetical protein
MKNLLIIIIISAFLQTALFSQEERNVLVEVFTNSHCPVCPPAHNTLLAYDQNSPNAENINYIFYHMAYPYSDDALYQANTSDSQGRDLYYGPFGSTPKAFFDGTIQQNNYGSWDELLDQRATASSPLRIALTGTKADNIININAEVIRTGNITTTDLVIHFVVVENVFYQGRNNIANHRNVMRRMVTSPAGESFSINENETKLFSKPINLSSGWIPDSLGVAVFVQSSSSKEVHQSAHISYSELQLTGIDDGDAEVPGKYYLEQNYPNPFNPVTNIKFSIQHSGFVQLKLYDVLGREINTLVNEYKTHGFYEIEFDAGEISGGVYFYKLQSGNYSDTKKMILLK